MKSTLDLMTETDHGNALQDSESTSKNDAGVWMSGDTTPTDTDSFSGEEGFFEALGADFRSFACSLRKTAGGVASFVKHSAMNVAAEINRLEEDAILAHSSDDSDRQARGPITKLPLPWEVSTSGPSCKEDCRLRERILGISSDDDTFLQPFTLTTSEDFCMDEPRIDLIRRLLEIDDNLAATYARLAGQSDVYESVFWKNYFNRCEIEKKECTNEYLSKMQSNPSQDSLVPDDDTGLGKDGDEANSCESYSFVATSPPSSANSSGSLSVDSMVIVGIHRSA